MPETSSPRGAGVLLHVTSLPSGRLDDDALRWLDFMAESELGVWQMLPLVIPDTNGSPYQSASAFASDPRLLPREPIPVDPDLFDAYCQREAHWLNDFATFQVLKRHFDGKAWVEWSTPFRDREQGALEKLATNEHKALDEIKRQQFRLDQAWQRIRTHATDLGIQLFGDIPIFVAHDSADTWANPDSFLLDEQGQPTFVTGVPPDYFSDTGQRWGNPHYRWEHMQTNGFQWWLHRMQRQFDLFDLVRIDHFRGLVAVWMIDAACETAIDGYWQETPGDVLLDALQAHFAALPIIAEDLGVITEEVRALRRKYGLPGMAVLQFAFDHFADNPHKPANINSDDIVYTGTHDNNTCVGWFKELQAHEKDFVFEILGSSPRDDIAQLMIETAMHTQALLAIAPLQDYLGLGPQARMNTPGVAEGNWRWRFHWDMLTSEHAKNIRQLVEASGRSHES